MSMQYIEPVFRMPCEMLLQQVTEYPDTMSLRQEWQRGL